MMILINICLYLYVALKPFYLTKSGTLQISDVFIVIAFGALMLTKKIKINKEVVKNFKVLLIFMMSVIIINIIYYYIYRTQDFIMSTAYYIFAYIGLIIFSTKLDDYKFLRNMYKIFIFEICIQLFIYFLGIGRDYATIRYMGTFNDPNQFGFFIVMSIMYLYTLENILGLKKRAIYAYIIGMYLIYLSASTGMILAIATFFIIQLCYVIKALPPNFKKYIKKALTIIFIFLFSLAVIILISNFNSDFANEINNFIDEKIINSPIVKRVEEKIDKNKKEEGNLIEERGIDKLIKYPQYILFGAGQGNYSRFPKAFHKGEIHSTIPSILFSYGIIPTCILVYWVYNNLKGLNLKSISIYIAILIESFTLLNQRQLLLWLLIVLANTYKWKKSVKTDENVVAKK